MTVLALLASTAARAGDGRVEVFGGAPTDRWVYGAEVYQYFHS